NCREAERDFIWHLCCGNRGWVMQRWRRQRISRRWVRSGWLCDEVRFKQKLSPAIETGKLCRRSRALHQLCSYFT
ncbi:MAG: hypothetical protein EB082_08010, partial [Verrucomicrobia bacterium]|nr:hypothetical protein [Verrucomicrobiota bacterium]